MIMSLRVFPDTVRSLTLARQGQVQDGARSNLLFEKVASRRLATT